MAVVAPNNPRWVTPAGMGFTDRAQAATDLLAGQLVVFNGTTPNAGHDKVCALAGASAVDPNAVVLQDCKAGDSASLGIIGEMDGFSTNMPAAGTALFASATPGSIDTTVVASAQIRMRAVSATRIRFNFT